MILHKTKGVNPRLTFCPRCGGDGPDLILLGNRDSVITCPFCNTANYGAIRSDKCGSCGQPLSRGESRKIEEHERIPGSLCKTCKEEVENFKKEVEKGGIYWKCKCGATGVIKGGSELAVQVREKSGIKEGPVGVELDKCWVCEKGAKDGKEDS